MTGESSELLLEVRGVSGGYSKNAVVRDVHLSLCAGDILCLLGPNGCGKTTLFRVLTQALPCLAGDVLLCGRSLRELPLREVARRIGYVPQSHAPRFPYTLRTLVAMGRTAHLGLLASPSRADFDLGQALLDHLDIGHLGDQAAQSVSGGELQLALVARALAQEPKILLMDEPTSALDYGNQVRVLDCITELAREGMAIVMTTHAPDQALRISHRTALMRAGHIVACGPTVDVVTGQALSALYGISLQVVESRLSDGSVARSCLPLRTVGASRSPRPYSSTLAENA
jgi:iron complex transport system ATP-binding protein